MNIAEKVIRAKADYDEVYDAGKKAEYDAFWDNFQNNGDRNDYRGAYGNWNEDIFKPKYSMIVSVATEMFFQFKGELDIESRLSELGVSIDYSNCTSFTNMCNSSNITRLGVIDARKATTATNTFIYCRNLKTIGRFIVPAAMSFTNAFLECSSLENITFEGVIGQNGLDLHWSTKLSKASITSIINTLSSTTSGLTVTLSKTAVNNAFTTEEWNALVATKTNCTISLI